MLFCLFILVAASMGPLAFPMAQLGYASLHDLAVVAILPSIAALLAIWVASRRSQPEVASMLRRGLVAGVQRVCAASRLPSV
ncbi:MAG: hypothetical protein ACRD2X_01700, partial [Vicinamibacteraceae bacterium]